jgi:AcrR family transcriptional regulator
MSTMARKSGRDGARERILEAAACLFYQDGIHAVGVDTIIAESGVAKMTLYCHFPSKDDLIVAYSLPHAARGQPSAVGAGGSE